MSEERSFPSLEELDAKLKAARGQRDAISTKGGGSKAEAGSGLGMALKVGVEFVSAVGVGVAIGLLLDYWLETKPWLMIVFFLLGSAAGFKYFPHDERIWMAGYSAKGGEKKPEGKGSK